MEERNVIQVRKQTKLGQWEFHDHESKGDVYHDFFPLGYALTVRAACPPRACTDSVACMLLRLLTVLRGACA